MPQLARLETFHNEYVCFVRATAEDGPFSWGQTSTYTADITAWVFQRQVVPWALGADIADIPGLVHLIERLEHKDPGSYRGRALAGLDTALWDMAGRRAGKPVTMCTMHLLVATPNAGKYLELSIEGDDYYPWQRDLFVGQPFTVTDGHVTMTDTPGWGVEISPAWLDRATYTDAALESFRPSAYGALYHKGGKP